MLRVSQLNIDQRIHDLSVQCELGQQIHLVGPNGAGKSTLLAAIATVICDYRGDISWYQQPMLDLDVGQLSHFRSYQEQSQPSAFGFSVKQLLSFFSPCETIPAELEQALEINAFLERSMNALSGGELRRVSIARALLQVWPAIEQGKALVLLDEPLQGMDLRHQSRVLSLLQRISQAGSLVIVSCHDLALTERYADKVCLLKDGRLVDFGPPQDCLTQSQLTHVFDCPIECHTVGQHRIFCTRL